MKTMTREERLKYCKICINRRLDLKRGLVCRLTDEFADFNSYCENFVADKIEMEYSDTKAKMKKEERKEIFRSAIRKWWILILYVAILGAALFFSLQPLVKSIIITVAVLIIADIIIMRRLEKKITLTYLTRIRKRSDEKRLTNDDELTIDRIIYIVRKEGYVPQRVDEQSVVFKFQRNTFNIDLHINSTYRIINIYVQFLLNAYFDEAEISAMRIIRDSALFSKIIVDREDNSIIFAFANIFKSAEEFENLFPHIISMLLYNIDEHQKLVYSLVQDELSENTSQKRKIGFPVTPTSDTTN